MGYFAELPDIQFINRTKNEVSNDETIILKNLFKRAKLREDIANVATAFEYYNIEGNERPDQVAAKFYEDPELDWVILYANNITNVQQDWPLDQESFNRYLTDKYGSEDAWKRIKHYETISLKDQYGREVFPGGLIVDSNFYNSPVYESMDQLPPGITFPSIYISGTPAELNPIVSGAANSITSVTIANGGLGFSVLPNISVSDPPVTADSTAGCTTLSFAVNAIVGLNGGQGYNFTPSVTFDSPPTSVKTTAICGLTTGGSGVGFVSVTEPGIGYGLTAPTIEFALPPDVFGSADFVKESILTIGSQVEGIFISSDGLHLYTSSTTGSNQIKEYSFNEAWNSSTLVLENELDVSTDFGFTTGVDAKPDGTRIFVTGGQSGSYKIIAYDLSTPWDLSTATKVGQSNIANPGGIRFKPDGTRMFVLDATTPDIIKEYSLSTDWDITTRSGGTVNTLNISTPTGDNNILGFTFDDNGTKIYATGSDSASIYEFDLDSWQINTATYKTALYVGSRSQFPCDVFLRSDKEVFIISGSDKDKLVQYNVTSRAKATSQVTTSSVSAVTVTNAGVGYTEPPSVTFSDPSPAVTATATANLLSGIVTSITITNAGFGYTTTPSVTITPAPISRKADIKIAIATTSIVSNGYTIQDINYISEVIIRDGGLNYVNSPTITVDLPSDLLQVEEDDLYIQDNRTWKWSGTEWQEKTTEEFQYLDTSVGEIKKFPGTALSRPVSYYEYEERLNDQKRQILVLRPEYVSVILSDMRNIMSYDPESPNYINDKLISTYNPKITGV